MVVRVAEGARGVALAGMLALTLLGATAVAARGEPPPPGPPAPTTTAGAGSIEVVWSPPVSPPSPVLGYRVEVGGAATGPWGPPLSGTCAGALGPAARACQVTGLRNGRAVFVRVVAVYTDDVEAPSPATGPTTPRGLPAAVPAPVVTRDYRAAEVRWQPPTTDSGSPITGFTVLVRRSGTGAWGPPPAGTCRGPLLNRACRIAGLTGGVRYYVRVGTTNAVGTRLSLPSPVTPLRLGDVTLAFGGDVHFEGSAYPRGLTGGLSGLRSVFAGADISMVNLETAIATSGRSEDKQYVFRAPPRVLRALADGGVDVVTMANNHGRDYGASGMQETLNARRTSPVPIVGVGESTTDAIRPWVTVVKGTTIAVLGIVGLDLAQEENVAVAASWPARTNSPGLAVWADHSGPIRRAVARWSAKADVVVVYVHWGRERATCSSGAQRAVARALVESGADLIVGAHPHVLQGAGYLGNSLVAMSLGNFVWYTSAGRPSAALMVRLRDGAIDSYEWRPSAYSGTGYPYLVSGSERQSTLDLLSERSAPWCSGLAPRAGALTALTTPGPAVPWAPPPLTPLEALRTPGRE